MLMRWRDTELERIEISASLKVSDEVHTYLVDTIGERQRRWPKRDLDLEGAAVIDDELLHAQLWITSHKASDEEHHTRLALEVSKRRPAGNLASRQRRNLENRFRAIESIMGAISTRSLECDIHCTMAWRFLAELTSSIVQLPLLTVSVPGTAYGQISGVRFTSTSANPDEYVAIDLIGDKNLRVLSHLVVSDILSSDILDKVFDRGKLVKDGFVKPKDKD